MSNLVRWDPFTEMTSLSGAVDWMFRELFQPATASQNGGRRSLPTFQLPVDVTEDEGGYRIQASLPGFTPEQVEVTVNDGILTIDGKLAEEKTEESGKYLRREIYRGNFRRQMTLPADVRAEEVKADFADGVLTVTVPRVPKPEPVKVAIGSGS
jgi:HSP20 family protein